MQRQGEKPVGLISPDSDLIVIIIILINIVVVVVVVVIIMMIIMTIRMIITIAAMSEARGPTLPRDAKPENMMQYDMPSGNNMNNM